MNLKNERVDACINLTRRCNLSCKECYIQSLLKYPVNKSANDSLEEVDIPLKKIQKIFNQRKIDHLYLTGGEPLMHPQFYEIFSWAVLRSLKVCIATNGLILNEGLKKLFLESNACVLWSIRGTHRKIFKTIEKYSHEGLDIHAYYLPEEDSEDTLKDFIRKCPSVKKIRLLYNSKNSPNCIAWYRQLAFIHSFLKPYNLEVSVEIAFLPNNHPIVKLEDRGACSRIIVDTDGLVYACPLLVFQKNGKENIPPSNCERHNCPIFLKNLDTKSHKSICTFVLTDLKNIEILTQYKPL